MRTFAQSSEQISALGESSPKSVNLIVLDTDTHWLPRPDHRYRGLPLMVKRTIDVTGALVLAILLLPLLTLTAAAIRLSSRGPVIYRQDRVGRDGEVFTIYKFRTMRPDAEQWLRSDPTLYRRYLDGGFKIACADDPRITRLGALLRKSSIDELPQLWNVLRGEMSLVGPRPVVPEELAQYGQYVNAYLMAVPGLTGPWQVSGRDAVKFPGRALFDAEYIDRWSVQRDLRIIAKTLPAAVSARGVE